MLTCKDASKLVSEGLDRPLRLHERWSLQLHLWICGNCSRFASQMKLFRKTLHACADHQDSCEQEPVLPDEAKKRIREAIAKQEHSSK